MGCFCLLAVLTAQRLSVALFGVCCLNSDVLSLLKDSSELLLEIADNISINDSTAWDAVFSSVVSCFSFLFTRGTVCCVIYVKRT